MVILTFPNNSRSSCNNPPSAKKGAFGGLRQGRSRNSSFARSMWSDLGLRTKWTYPGVKTLADYVVAPFDTLATFYDPSGIGPAMPKAIIFVKGVPIRNFVGLQAPPPSGSSRLCSGSKWSDSLATSPEERSVASSLTSQVSENLGVYLGGKNW